MDNDWSMCSGRDLLHCLGDWGVGHVSLDDFAFHASSCCFGDQIPPTHCIDKKLCCGCFAHAMQALAMFESLRACFFRDLCLRDIKIMIRRTLRALTLAHGRTRRLLGTFIRTKPAQLFLRMLNDTEETVFGIRSVFDASAPWSHASALAVCQLYEWQRFRKVLFNQPRGSRALNIITKQHYEHHSVFALFPPEEGPSPNGQFMDFLGVSNQWINACKELPLVPGRALECLSHADLIYLRQWPIVDEEYFEWIDVLDAVATAANRGGEFAMAEIGSHSEGVWAVRAAKAFYRLVPSARPCSLIVVAPVKMANSAIVHEHLQNNVPHERCKLKASAENIGSNSSRSLSDVLDHSNLSDIWDLVDMDCQGCEENVIRKDLHQLARRVRRLHISTHSREIHSEILIRLNQHGWSILAAYDHSFLSKVANFEHVVAVDGHITATSPVFTGS
eukprot:TRINITY_DN8745_c0_g3_i1.p1 TRINITY_DN8745_c0_g3~~TRINITY_DN8745_c0_g3_i1.p1  ORF type:complete len:447 (-),score=34.49 TRINITY_DN8745_c0_g3_i1:43-1383(-)